MDRPARVPAFARDFPRDPALDRLVDLFEQGNYARLRKDAQALLQSSEDTGVRAATKELLTRIEPDPLARGLVLLAAVLLVFLSGWYWTQRRALSPPAAPTSAPASAPQPAPR